jgi:hypothetical protein
MNESELRNILARNPQLTATDNLGHRDPVSQRTRDQSKIPAQEPKRRAPDALASVATGETKSMGRPRVSFMFRYSREGDADRFRGGEKDLLDGLVKAGLLPGDEKDKIILDPYQEEKVAHRHQEETVITIRYE